MTLLARVIDQRCKTYQAQQQCLYVADHRGDHRYAFEDAARAQAWDEGFREGEVYAGLFKKGDTPPSNPYKETAL